MVERGEREDGEQESGRKRVTRDSRGERSERGQIE